MNSSQRQAAGFARFPAPRSAAPRLAGSRAVSGDCSGPNPTPPCRGKACCIKPTDDAQFCIKTVGDAPIPVDVDGTVAIDGPVQVDLMLGSEPLEVAGCIGVEMCGSEPLCVQLENKPETTICTTSFAYAPVSSIMENTGCAYSSSSFGADEESFALPFYYATNVPVVCAPSDKIVRIKSLQQRFNSGPVTDLSAGLTGWKIASSDQYFLQSNSFEEMEMVGYTLQNPPLSGLPCDIACQGLGIGENTFVYSVGDAFGSGIGVDLAPNDVLVGTVEASNPNDEIETKIYPYYSKAAGGGSFERVPNFQAGDFKAVSCCQARPSCVEPLSGVPNTFVTDLQVFESAAGGEGEVAGLPAVPFCLVDCENAPITGDRDLVVEMDAQQLGAPFTVAQPAVKLAGEVNKFEAKFTLSLQPNLITVNQLRVRDVPSDTVLFASTETFFLGFSA